MASIWDDPYVMSRGGKGPLPKSGNKPRWDSTNFKYKRPGEKGNDFSGAGYDSFNKYNILKSQQTNDSIPDQMNSSTLNFNNHPMGNSGGMNYGPAGESGPGGGTNWWDKIGKQLGADGALGGIKGWLDLGVEGMKAWTGYQQVGLAREENQLGRDAFGFQKAAWNKDYDARKIAYNTNARDVNAWKAAQTPGGYTMSELVV